jgi:hypothetical protein
LKVAGFSYFWKTGSMKNLPLKYFFRLAFLVFCGCQSSRPSLLFSAASITANPENLTASTVITPQRSGNAFPVQQAHKTVMNPAEKVLYTANLPQPKQHSVRQNPAPKTKFSQAISAFTKTKKTTLFTRKKIEEELPGHEHENRLSGILVGSGMALLLVSLVLLLAGSSAAGLFAIIGGAIFLIGFVLCMAELLGD